MRANSSKPKASAERVVKDIRRATRRHFSAEDKIRGIPGNFLYLLAHSRVKELCQQFGGLLNRTAAALHPRLDQAALNGVGA